MTSVLVAGALAARPRNAGGAWVRLSWVLGFSQLGCDVRFVEEIDSASPEAVAWFDAVTRDFGLTDNSWLLDRSGRAVSGAAGSGAITFARDCDLLVNISGNLRFPKLLAACKRRAYLDLDPGYTQRWMEQGLDIGADGHHLYFSVAERLGQPGCSLPSAGLPWIPVRQPVLLSEWPFDVAPRQSHFTTVATWRNPFGPLEIGERQFGMKAHEFRKLAGLPQIVDAEFELATDFRPGDNPDRALLESSGWTVVDSNIVAPAPDAFRKYIQGSSAEISPAQPVYVECNSGWFSDRTTRYLATGRPVLVQDTGIGDLLPIGEGLLTFTNIDEAAAGARAILSDYPAHAAAARQIAETHFDSGHVLSAFLERTGVA